MTINCPQHYWKPPHPPRHDDCLACWARYGQWHAKKIQSAKLTSKGRAAGGGSSARDKGRRGAALVAAAILRAFPMLDSSDVRVKHPNTKREDLKLSARAQALFPFCFEVKFTELLSIWDALKQAERYRAAGYSEADQPELVFFKRAHSKLYAALPADMLLACIARSKAV